MRRILLVFSVVLVIAAMVVATAATAFAAGPIGPAVHNPHCSIPFNTCTVPAADVWPNEGDEAGFVDRSKAPVADGGDPPKQGAKGGNPGSDLFFSDCLKHSDSC
jgi:hypothetical protein